MSTEMFFRYNTALGPPYQILLDTNFINFSIQNKLELFKSFMDCLLAKCIPIITDCVMAELEKLGHKYHVALRIAKDPRIQRLKCTHKGTYADDCIVQRVTMVRKAHTNRKQNTTTPHKDTALTRTQKWTQLDQGLLVTRTSMLMCV